MLPYKLLCLSAPLFCTQPLRELKPVLHSFPEVSPQSRDVAVYHYHQCLFKDSPKIDYTDSLNDTGYVGNLYYRKENAIIRLIANSQ